MNYKYEIDSEDLERLHNALKISKKEFDSLLKNGSDGSNAERIVKARKALGMSNYEGDCVHDLSSTP